MLPLQGVWVLFLVGELRSHMLYSEAKKEEKKFFLKENTQRKSMEH